MWVVVDIHQIHHDAVPAQVPPHLHHHQGVGQDQDHGQSHHLSPPWRREG